MKERKLYPIDISDGGWRGGLALTGSPLRFLGETSGVVMLPIYRGQRTKYASSSA